MAWLPRPAARVPVFWLLLLIASLGGLLAIIDGRLFDVAVRLVPGPTPDSVAIVHGSPADVRAALDRLGPDAPRAVLQIGTAGQAGPGSRNAFAADIHDGCRAVSPDGVVRALRLRDARGRPCPLARLAMAARLALPGAHTVSPDFSITTSTAVPRVDAGDDPETAILRAALARRLVVHVPVPDPPTYVTPLHAADGLLEPSILHALALDAIARGRIIRWLPPGADVALAAVVVLLLHLLLHRVRYATTLIVALAATVPMVLASVLALHLLQVFVPVTATLVALAAFAVHTLIRRNSALSATLLDMDQRLTGIVGHPIGKGFELEIDVVWLHANRFVTGFFNLQRSVMLALPAGSTHLRVVATFGCEGSDIMEKRRDYRRAPYNGALAREVATAPSRPFFLPEEGVDDFIAPLVAADQLVGYWCFSVARMPQPALEVLAAEATRYAQEVAKMLLRASGRAAARNPSARAWPTLNRLRGRLLDNVTRAREQLAAYRDVFSAVGHPIAICDLLGQLQMANPAFEDFAERSGRPLMTMTIPQLLEHYCEVPSAMAKDIMRRMMLGDGADTRLPIRDAGDATPLVVAIRPILRSAQAAGDVAASPFDRLGMIVEILPDLREMAPRLPTGSGNHDGGVSRAGEDAADLRAIMQRVLQSLAGLARSKQLVVGVPPLAFPVAAPAPQLERFLRDLLVLLIDDAAPGSTLHVTCDGSEPGRVLLQFSNAGYAMPEWLVQDLLHAGASRSLPKDPSPLERLAHSAAALDGSIGFRLEPRLGEGYLATLTLRRDA